MKRSSPRSWAGSSCSMALPGLSRFLLSNSRLFAPASTWSRSRVGATAGALRDEPRGRLVWSRRRSRWSRRRSSPMSTCTPSIRTASKPPTCTPATISTGARRSARRRQRQEEENRAHLIERQQSLQTVADWTGGRAVMNTNAPEASVRPILEESSAYYLLGFQTSDVKTDGRFHPITVKVNRPDVQVRTRKGYYADAVTAAGPATEGPAVAGSRLPRAAAGAGPAHEHRGGGVPRRRSARRW